MAYVPPYNLPQVAKVPTVLAPPQVPVLPKAYQYPKAYVRYEPQESLTSDYNDPYEINSLADVILGSFNKDMEHTKFFGLEKIPLLNIVSDTMGLAHRTTLKPLLKGRPDISVMNLLMNLGETLDVPNQIVKAGLQEGGSGVANALGWGNHGRKNYDWHTGNFITDVGAELLSDPLNWVTLFGKAAVSAGVKGAIKTTIKETIGDVAKEVTEKQFNRLTRRAVSAYLLGDYDTMSKAIGKVAAKFAESGSLIFRKELRTPEFVKAMQSLSKLSTGIATSTTLQSLQKVIAPVEGLQRILMKGAMQSSGITPAWWAISRGGNWVSEFMTRNVDNALKQFKGPDGIFDIYKYDEASAAYADLVDNLNMVNKLNDEELLSSETFKILIQESVKAKKAQIDLTMQKYWKDPEEMKHVLRRILNSPDSENPLDDYLAQIKSTNEKMGGDLGVFEDHFQDLVDRLKVVEEYKRVKESVKAIDLRSSRASKIYDQLAPLFDEAPPIAKIDFNNPFVNKADLKYNNLRVHTALAIDEFAHAKKMGVPESPEYTKLFFEESFAEYNAQYVDPVITNFKKELTVVPDASLTEVLNAFEGAVKEAIQGTLNTISDAVDAGTDLNNIVFKFDEYAIKLGEITDSYNQIFDEIKDALKPNEVLGKVYKSYSDRLNFAERTQNPLIQKIQDSQFEKEARKTNIDILEPDNIDNIKKQIVEIFTDDPEQYISQIKDIVGGDDHVLIEAINSFLAVNPTDMEAYSEVWTNLQRIVQGIADKLKNNAPVSGERIYYNKIKTAQHQVVKRLEDYVVDMAKHLTDKTPAFIQDIITTVKKYTGGADDIPGLQRDILASLSKGDVAKIDKKLIELIKDVLKQTESPLPKGYGKPPVKHSTISSDATPTIMNIGSTDPADFATLLEMLADNHPVAMTNRMISLGARTIYYELKLSQLYTNMSLMNIEKVNELVASINNNAEGLGAYIHTMANSFNGPVTNKATGQTANMADAVNIAREIINMSTHFDNYAHFLNDLSNSNIRDLTHNIFLDVVQGLAGISPRNFLNNFDYKFKELIQKIEDYANSDAKRSLKLEKLQEDPKVKKAMMELYGVEKLPAHEAEADVKITEAVIRAFLKKKFPRSYIKYIICDIETPGFNANIGSVHQIGWKVYGGESGSLIRKLSRADTFDIPAESFLASKYKDLPELDTVEKRLDYYIKASEKGMYTDEQAMLQSFIDMLKTNDQKLTQLVFHNGEGFDIGQLMDRMKRVGISDEDINYFEHFIKKDTLAMLRELDGFYTVGLNEQLIIRKHLKKYALKQDGPEGIDKLIAPNNGAFANLLKKLADDLGQIQTNKAIGKSGIDKRVAIDPDWEHLVRTASTELYEKLKQIGSDNRQWKNQFLSKEKFEDGLYNKFFTDYVNENIEAFMAQYLKRHPIENINLTNPAHYEKVKQLTLLQYTQHLNASKMLFSLTDGFSQYAYRKAIDVDGILEYFKYSQADEISLTMGKALTKVSKGFERSRMAIKNPHLIKPYEAHIKLALHTLVPQGDLKSIMTVWGDTPSARFYSHLRLDKDDLISNWIMLQYIYRQYVSKNNNNVLKQKILGFIDPDLRRLLDRPQDIYRKEASIAQMNYFKESASIKVLSNHNMANPAKLREVYEDLKASRLALENLGNDIDTHKLSQAKYFAISAELAQAEDMIKEYAALLDESIPLQTRSTNLRNIGNYSDSIAHQPITQTLAIPKMPDGTYNVNRLLAHMLKKAPYITFDVADIITDNTRKGLFYELLSHKNELKAADIHIVIEKTRVYMVVGSAGELHRVDGKWFYRKTNSWSGASDEFEIEDVLLKDIDYDLAAVDLAQPKLVAAIKEAGASLNRMTKGKSVGSSGQLIFDDFYKEMFDRLPDSVKKVASGPDMFSQKELFKETRFNWSNLGSHKFRKEIQEFAPRNLVTAYKNTITLVAQKLDAKEHYLNMLFAPWLKLKNIVPDLDLNDVATRLQEYPEYKLVALVEDKNVGYRVASLNPKTVEEAQQALDLDAILVPYHVYSNMYETINMDRITDKALDFWRRLIYTYKIGYLSDPGVWVRNFVEGTFKTMIETQTIFGTILAQYNAVRLLRGFKHDVKEIINLNYFNLEEAELIKQLEQMPEVIRLDLDLSIAKNRLRAMETIQRYNEDADKIFLMEAHGGFSKENIDFYFQYMKPKLSREDFDLAHLVTNDTANIGPTADLQELFFKQGLRKDDTEKIWRTFVHQSNKLITFNRLGEQINRLAQYYIIRDRGLSNSTAFFRIAQTHFDFGLKTPFEKMMENIIPFYTFFIRNLDYWITAAEKYPWMVNMFKDIMTPVFDFDNIDHTELNNNRSLQSQILAGNIPIGDDGFNIKLNPSFMDALNTIANPTKLMQGKLAAPIQTSLDFILQNSKQFLSQEMIELLKIYDTKDGEEAAAIVRQLTNLIPLFGAGVQRYTDTGPKYYDRTGNVANLVAPGLFGGTLRYQDRFKKNRTIYAARPRRSGKKTYPRKAYSKTIYAKAYRAKRPYRPEYYNNFGLRSGNYDSLYREQYSKTGKSRLKAGGFGKITPYTNISVKYRIKNTWGYFR